MRAVRPFPEPSGSDRSRSWRAQPRVRGRERTGADQGCEELVQIARADSVLAVSRPNGYGKGL